MKSIPAIVEPAEIDLDLIDRQLAVEIAGERDDIRAAERHESEATRHVGAARAARESAAARRKRIGAALCKARPLWPARGFAPKNAKLPPGAPTSWAEYLKRHDLDDATARRYMDEYRDPETFAQKQRALSEGRPTATDAADDDDEPFDVAGQERDAPPFRQLTEEDLEQAIARLDPEARDRLLRRARVNVSGGSGDSERATWRTSKLWAERVGPWDLDPFSNPRSVILSVARCMLEDGGDGFGGGEPGVEPGRYLTGSGHGQQPIGGVAGASTRVWLQPPYTNGFVERVVSHYGHTRFCALLRLDPSTEWFAALWERTKLLAIPIGTREMFEPPPGVKASSNPQPHAFYYSDARDVTPAIAETCILLDRYEALRLVR